MKLVHLFMAGTVMLVTNGASAESVVKPFHLDEATISDVQAAYRSGALTAARLVQAYLERIQRIFLVNRDGLSAESELRLE